MNAKALIRKTRVGEELAPEEIEYLVQGATSGRIPDYQLTAWMMAVFFRGLTDRETADLTRAMLSSGQRLSFPEARFLPADKHSTGGVGDKVSFLVAPLVAAAGIPVPMISGRSLGHTGGTLDKLESIPGLRTSLGPDELVRQVREIGLCIAGQSGSLAPADRVLYALRDAASIVESAALITASILSKKAAAGVGALALDVKFGSGAFMAGPAEATDLAGNLVETATLLGIRARAHLTRMDHVLGRTAGNALEIDESARALRDPATASPDLKELTLALGGSLCELSGAVVSRSEGERRIEQLWRSGAGLEKFQRMIERQGGDPGVLEGPGLPRATEILEVRSPRDGILLGVRARPCGEWITEAGGGRLRADDVIDPRVGVEILVDPGRSVRRGEPLLVLHLGAPAGGDLAKRAASWLVLAESPFGSEGPPLLAGTVDPLPRPS